MTVKLKGDTGDAAYTTRTERDGAFLFHGICPEPYVLSVHAANRRLCREEIDVASTREFIRRDLRLLQA